MYFMKKNYIIHYNSYIIWFLGYSSTIYSITYYRIFSRGFINESIECKFQI